MKIDAYFNKYHDDANFEWTSKGGFRQWVLRTGNFFVNRIGQNRVDEAGLCALLGIEVKND